MRNEERKRVYERAAKLLTKVGSETTVWEMSEQTGRRTFDGATPIGPSTFDGAPIVLVTEAGGAEVGWAIAVAVAEFDMSDEHAMVSAPEAIYGSRELFPSGSCRIDNTTTLFY